MMFTNDGGLPYFQLFAGWAHSHPPLFVFLLPPLGIIITLPLFPYSSVISQAVRWLALILIHRCLFFPTLHPH